MRSYRAVIEIMFNVNSDLLKDRGLEDMPASELLLDTIEHTNIVSDGTVKVVNVKMQTLTPIATSLSINPKQGVCHGCGATGEMSRVENGIMKCVSCDGQVITIKEARDRSKKNKTKEQK